MQLSSQTYQQLNEACLTDPFQHLGLLWQDDRMIFRVYRPHLVELSIQVAGHHDADQWLSVPMVAPHLFEAVIGEADDIGPVVTCRGVFADSAEHEWVDPYSFHVLLSEWDLDRFREGHHHHIDQVLGAHATKHFGIRGIQFAVWAPAAERVSVVGAWNHFDGRLHSMRLRHPYGIWEIFIPEAQVGQTYKFEIRSRSGQVLLKADPYAQEVSVPPETNSIIPKNRHMSGRMTHGSVVVRDEYIIILAPVCTTNRWRFMKFISGHGDTILMAHHYLIVKLHHS